MADVEKALEKLQTELDKIDGSGGPIKVKIKNEEGKTRWLDITMEDYLQMETLLKSSAEEIAEVG